MNRWHGRLILAATALVVLLPFMLVLAALIRLTSPGPAIFRQQRCGLNGRLFTFYKFRSMCDNAEQLKASVAHLNRKSTAFKIPDDPRLTRIGRVLRKFSIDEWPQLWNVIRGEMSLVGPRPEVPRYVALYPPEIRDLVLSVRPGITDRASIEFRDEGRLLAEAADPERCYVEQILPRKLAYYADYARKRSLAGDVVILFDTLAAVFGRPR